MGLFGAAVRNSMIGRPSMSAHRDLPSASSSARHTACHEAEEGAAEATAELIFERERKGEEM